MNLTRNLLQADWSMLPVTLCCVLAALRSMANPPPNLPPLPTDAGHVLLQELAVLDNAEAQARFQPMQDTAPAACVQAGPRNAVRLRCNFDTLRIPRASWDVAVRLDLGLAKGLAFRFYCPSPEPIEYLSCYLKSKDGWYVSTFAPETIDGWNTIRIDKATTSMEGDPGGWSDIDTLRISAWRGAREATDCYIADIGIWNADGKTAVLLNTHGRKRAPDSAEEIRVRAAGVSTLLDALGIPQVLLLEEDLLHADIATLDAIMLPYCPALEDASVTALSAFIAGGGAIVAFHTLPEKLARAADIDVLPEQPARSGTYTAIACDTSLLPGAPRVVHQQAKAIREIRSLAGRSRTAASWLDTNSNPVMPALILSRAAAHMNQTLAMDNRVEARKLLLAMLGTLKPRYWETAATAAVKQVQSIGPYGSLTSFRAAATGDAAKLLDRVSALQDQARELLEGNKYADAVNVAEEARQDLVNAYCMAQTSRPGEFRGFWCHRPFGVQGKTWDEAIQILAENGFTAIFPNMSLAGTAYYDSTVLPVAPEIAEQGDQITKCLEACRRYGIACHIWKISWNMAGVASPGFVAEMKKAGRTQVQFDGTPEDQWLCPSHPANQQLEIDAMVEIADKYPVDGIHFDYIRYPHADACFCRGCRKRFEDYLGKQVRDWPADVRADATIEARWNTFRREQITAVAAAVSTRARSARPGIAISAAVFPDWHLDRDRVAQDWRLWCEKGYLDFVCPMNYTQVAARFKTLVKRQLNWAGETPLYAGIGLSVWSDPTDVVRLIEQIGLVRDANAQGFVVFDYAREAVDLLPMLGVGITAPGVRPLVDQARQNHE